MIIISHRLSSLMKADAILVLDQGEVNDVGRHEELLERNDIYGALWHQQNSHLVAPPARQAASGVRPLSPNQAALATVRQFQSETEAIREAGRAAGCGADDVVRAVGFLLSARCVHVSDQARSRGDQPGRQDRSGRPGQRFQALDTSIIKSIDVREGDQVKAGQLLATLDPTFAAADVTSTRLQIASLEAQIARDEAELSGKPLVVSRSHRPRLSRTTPRCRRRSMISAIAQYNAQVTSFDAKIKPDPGHHPEIQKDDERYSQRDDDLQKIEDMRTTLAEHGTGSQLNLYISQDARLEVLRTMDITHNSLLEAKNTLASLMADRKAFIQQWNAQLSQDLVTTRNNLDIAKSSYEKASSTRIWFA